MNFPNYLFSSQSNLASSSSDTALGQKMTIMAGLGVAHKLYIYKKKKIDL